MSIFTAEEEIPAHFLAAFQAATPENVELFAACEAGDGPRAAVALEKGGLANYYDETKGGITAVHAAAAAADPGALAALTAFDGQGVAAPLFDVRSTAMKATPLHEAAAAGRSPQVAMLLAKRVDVNAANAYGNTALMVAAAANALAVCEALRGADADARAANARGQTALHMAVAGVGAALRTKAPPDDVLAVARLLLNTGAADANAADGHGQTPLHHVAAMRENDAVLALAKLLLAAGGHSKVRDANGAFFFFRRLFFLLRRCDAVRIGKRPSELGAGRATPRGELVKLLKNHERLVIDTAC